MSLAPHITVSRYPDPKAVGGWTAAIHPADRSWVLFTAIDGPPSLFVRAEVETGDGVTHEAYAPASVPA
jgi:hypothetical protein